MNNLSEKEKEVIDKINRKLTTLLLVLGAFLGGIWLLLYPPTFLQEPSVKLAEAPVEDAVENGVHLATGLIAQEGFELVQQNCGGCHSYKLVTQNKNTREGWLETIRWMQETQKLWDLGENESPLLDYLAANYGPEETGRRKQLVITEWYELEE